MTTTMAFDNNKATRVGQWAQQPFLQSILAQLQSAETNNDKDLAIHKVITPQHVLSFFFGVDYTNEKDVQENLVGGKCLDTMGFLWWGGGPTYDRICESFQNTIRHMAVVSSLEKSPIWDGTVDGCMAQMILLDQLSRNAFRGSQEAFAYDPLALQYAKKLAAHVQDDEDNDREARCASEWNTDSSRLTGELYPPYYAFVLLPFMHSEDIKDHETLLKLLSFLQDRLPAFKANWDMQLKLALEHKDVLEQFGRYPHRNSCRGRSNTPEEDAWLADPSTLPGWAR